MLSLQELSDSHYYNASNYFDGYRKRGLVKPTMMLHFSVELPYKTTLPDGFEVPRFTGTSFFQGQAVETSMILLRFSNSRLSGNAIVECLYGFNYVDAMKSLKQTRYLHLDPKDGVFRVFDYFLSCVNDVIGAYIYHSSDFSVYKLTLRMLSPSFQFRWIFGADSSVVVSPEFRLYPKGVPKKLNELSTSKADDVLKHVQTFASAPNPYSLSFDLFFDASRFFGLGHYRQSVLSLAMALESYLQQLWNDCNDLVVACSTSYCATCGRPKQNNKPKAMLKHNLYAILGDDFKFVEGSGISHSLWVNVYGLRNRVIHEGYSVTDREAMLAFAVMARFIEMFMINIQRVKPELSPYFTIRVSEITER